MTKLIATLILSGPQTTPEITHLHFDDKNTYIEATGCGKRIQFKMSSKDSADESLLDEVTEEMFRHCKK